MGLRARFLMPNRGGAAAVETYIEKVLGYSPIAYWPQNEASGTDAICQVDSPAQDGAYTGVTLGQTGIGDGETCPFFDGVNDVNNIYSAAFNAAFNGSEGTFHCWFKVSAVGVWTDASNDYTAQIDSLTAGNYIRVCKTLTNNQLQWAYQAGGVLVSILKNGVADVGWVPVAITWSATANEVKAYWKGIQEGGTQVGLGVWAGALDTIRCCVGASRSDPINPWSGWLAHPAVWDTPLTPSEILDLSTI